MVAVQTDLIRDQPELLPCHRIEFVVTHRHELFHRIHCTPRRFAPVLGKAIRHPAYAGALSLIWHDGDGHAGINRTIGYYRTDGAGGTQ
ncbi:MAG: hypothetical protein AMXMBFR59_39560 [Rhodanobacteraceae bacterium]